ncbi:uncharacterized protein LOC100821945 [Brachypodium distachyon]|uniref:Uncharacterized protein n=1 Tax=Brachypodium distachyon TaxID=15368 RepID=I1I4U2_BRADI|nr:uncharacterized protein LOC100821945 [Brachypodium distachyon]KQJ97166.1 hypothetical protein BRADI_3g29160v3 [Brachypodium distachyon]|eukprot:XP_003574083.1 uncharacterized protein LOC100821945 [Brachypodium distachyon]
MADRLLLLVLVAAAALSVLVPSPVAAARPCHTLLVSYSANANPSNDPDHRAPLTATVLTIFRVRRFGSHLLLRAKPGGHAHPHPDHRHHHHLHSIPANIQIRRPELPHPAAGAAAGIQERVKDILVIVVGILFGVGCGALTAASMYLVWSVIAGPGASSNYDGLYGDEEDDASDYESPKKVGYVIIPGMEAQDGGKN